MEHLVRNLHTVNYSIKLFSIHVLLLIVSKNKRNNENKK